MNLSKITAALEAWAPPDFQESYDNSGLLVGYPQMEISHALVCLDVTEAVVREAAEKGCDLIIAHHPLIFGSIQRLTGKNAMERCVMSAIRHGIAIYALHTNLDNVATGVNRRIGEVLGLEQMRILQPKKGLLQKLVVYTPLDVVEKVRSALFAAGAGSQGEYEQCSFGSEGTGTFCPGNKSNPHLGQKGKRHYEPEIRLEFLLEKPRVAAVLEALHRAHPYEEVAYDLLDLQNTHNHVGAGMLGLLPKAEPTKQFLKKIKNSFGGVLRHTALVHDKVQKIAWCGGSGSFLLGAAKAAGAQLFLSSDVKYHQFFEAENQIIIADIGHYENEQFTQPLIADFLREKFPTFAVLLTDHNTNPINYL